MSTGATIAVVAGIAGVGLVGFLALRKPTVAVGAVAKPPANASAGSLVASLGGALVGRLATQGIDELGDAISDWIS